jgi:hypothetical protein
MPAERSETAVAPATNALTDTESAAEEQSNLSVSVQWLGATKEALDAAALPAKE